MKPEITIAGRKIGYDHDPLIIAEIGINHGGSLDIAIKMVDAAINAGAEIIKHQTHVVDDEMSSHAKEIIPVHTNDSIYKIISDCSLDEEQEKKLQNYTEENGAIFISTPFSRSAAKRLIKMNIPAFKIGSGECNNYPLIEYIARAGKPIILSTGMNSIETIKRAVSIFCKYNTPYALLHCTNVYPTPPELVRLGALVEMQTNFPNAVIGLSDHTTTNYPSFGAISLGASIIERHFTDNMDRVGPDISCSMDPTALKELIEGTKLLKKARGGKKGIVEAEIPTANFAYASVVSIKNIKKGEKLSIDNIWVKRPGTGDILANDYDSLIGKKVLRNITIDTQISWKDLS